MSSCIADVAVPPRCNEMIRAGALVAIDSSGGKDSQCMTILLSRIVPREQLVVARGDADEVEQVAVLAGCGVGPLAGRAGRREPDEERARPGAANVAGGPVAPVLATVGGGSGGSPPRRGRLGRRRRLWRS